MDNIIHESKTMNAIVDIAKQRGLCIFRRCDEFNKLTQIVTNEVLLPL